MGARSPGHASAGFRLAAARYPDDLDFGALIAELQRDSEYVRDWWPRHDVTAVGKRIEEIAPTHDSDRFEPTRTSCCRSPTIRTRTLVNTYSAVAYTA